MSITQRFFEIDSDNGVTVIRPQGDAAGFRASEIERDIAYVHDQVAQIETPYVAVDLSRSAYFGSTVIGAIQSLGRQIREQGGELVVCHASDDMQKILEVMHLNELWMIFDDRKTALKALQAKRNAS